MASYTVDSKRAFVAKAGTVKLRRTKSQQAKDVERFFNTHSIDARRDANGKIVVSVTEIGD